MTNKYALNGYYSTLPHKLPQTMDADFSKLLWDAQGGTKHSHA
jgi:hypothetical protein